MAGKTRDINSPGFALAFIGALAVILAAAVSVIQVTTVKVVAGNESLRRSAVLVELFDLAGGQAFDRKDAPAIVEKHTDQTMTIADPKTGRKFPLVTAYREPRRSDGGFNPESLIGYAFEFDGLGFWAPIRGMLAVSPKADSVIGIAFTDQKETPGLGGRIEEKWFREKFAGLSIFVEPKAPKLINISLQEPPSGTHMVNRHVDAISGATQTCMALDRLLNENLESFQRAFGNRAAPQPQAEKHD
ncbi:MAG TPA: FMN-binding protein [Candidatus Brocadiia bacterium]|nr:FMN-binding protein [Candidatus Brocadiia bacterium]